MTHNREACPPMPEEIAGKLTVWGMFIRHYKPKRLLGKSKNTLRLYTTTIRKFGRFLGRPAMLDDFNDDNVAGHLAHLADSVSMHTVRKEFDQLVAIWRFAARRKLCDVYPELARPDVTEPVPDAFSQQELQQLLDTAGKLGGKIGSVPASLFWEAVIRVVYDTGERVGAVLLIDKKHVQDGWLLIPGEHRKGRKEGKRFKLSDRSSGVLARMVAVQLEEQVFHWPYCSTYFWNRFNKVVKKAGLPTDRRGKFHKIRRTVATRFEAAGGDATRLLGHSRRKVTERYLDTRYIKAPHPCDLIDPLP